MTKLNVIDAVNVIDKANVIAAKAGIHAEAPIRYSTLSMGSRFRGNDGEVRKRREWENR